MHISVLHTHTHTDKDGCVRERACMHAHAQAHATRCDDHDNAHPASASIHPSDTHTHTHRTRPARTSHRTCVCGAPACARMRACMFIWPLMLMRMEQTTSTACAQPSERPMMELARFASKHMEPPSVHACICMCVQHVAYIIPPREWMQKPTVSERARARVRSML